MSSGPAPAVRCWAGVDSGVVDVDDRHAEPVEPVGQLGGGDRGDRRGVGEHELDPRRRQRRIDRQVGRPGLEHRQDRHDRLGRPREQQRHTLAPGPRRGRPAGAPTDSTPRRAPGRSPTGRRSSPPPPRGCGPPARRTTPESTPAPAGRVSTARLPIASSRACSASSSRSTDDNAAPDRRSSPPTPAPTARSSASTLAASNTSVRNSTVPSIPAGSPASVQRSASENARSMRAVWVSTGSGVTCRSPKANPAAASSSCQEKFCQPNNTWTSG